MSRPFLQMLHNRKVAFIYIFKILKIFIDFSTESILDIYFQKNWKGQFYQSTVSQITFNAREKIYGKR